MKPKPDIVDLVNGFRIGEWTVHPRSGIFKRDGRSTHVEPKVMDVLLCLARAAGEVATREEILNCVWPQVVVTDEVLTRCISELRTLLGDTSRERRYVRTVPKRGYSLLLPVEILRTLPTESGILKQNANGHAVERSIAVLPFVDMSPRQDNQYFSDGLTEELTSALTHVTQLRVAARTSAFSLTGQNVDIKTIGDKLNVRHILEGSVRMADDKLRISTQLVNVKDGFQLWSQSFSRDLKDIFATQEEVACAVADKLKLQFGINETRRFMITGSSNLKACEAINHTTALFSRQHH
ncbi:MAG: winged helix-turn-helix domain-containing protein [Pseudomonadales bacterium]